MAVLLTKGTDFALRERACLFAGVFKSDLTVFSTDKARGELHSTSKLFFTERSQNITLGETII